MTLHSRADIACFTYKDVTTFLSLAGEDVLLHYEWDRGLYSYDYSWQNGWVLLFNHLYVAAGDPEVTLVDPPPDPCAACVDWVTDAGQWLSFHLNGDLLYVKRFSPFVPGGREGVTHTTWLPLKYLWDFLPKSKEIKEYVLSVTSR